MTMLLDRPIWRALTTRHEALACGDGRARRYQPGILPFAASVGDDPQALADLAELARPGETLLFLQADPVAVPDGFEVLTTAPGRPDDRGCFFFPVAGRCHRSVGDG